MKRLFCLFALAGVLSGMWSAQGQEPQAKAETRIYLWDVTLSMKGQGAGKPVNIYNKVVDYIVRDIQGLVDPNTEIVILPFQESILDAKSAKAKDAKELIQWIRACNDRFNTMSYTNIVGPLQTVQQTYLKEHSTNRVLLLTDGGNSNKFGGIRALNDLLKAWNYKMDDQTNFLYYVMLTSEAEVEDPNQQGVIMIEPSDDIPQLINLKVQEVVHFNLKDQQGRELTIPVGCKQNFALPEDLEFEVYGEADAPVNVPLQKVRLEQGKLHLTCHYSYEALHTMLAEHATEELSVKLCNPKHRIGEKNVEFDLNTRTITLQLINKPEKTLTIQIKK